MDRRTLLRSSSLAVPFITSGCLRMTSNESSEVETESSGSAETETETETETGGSSTPISWQSPTDWDNAVSQSGVVHASFRDYDPDTVTRGYSPDAENLEHYFSFDSDTDGFRDHVSTTTASLHGGQTDVDGMGASTAVSLDGENDYLVTDEIEWSGGDYTFVMWVKPDFSADTSTTSVFLRTVIDDDNNMGVGFGSQFAPGKWFFSWSNTHPGVTAEATFSAGEWVHIAAVRRQKDNTGELYVNGELKGTLQFRDGLRGRSPLYIGSRPESTPWERKFFDGTIDSLQLYDEALSSERIKELYGTFTGESTLTTSIKSFDSESRPDIESVEYSLNEGSIRLYITGSPDANEETKTIELSGSDSYDLSWTESHEKFRVRVDLSSEPTSKPPVFDGCVLR